MYEQALMGNGALAIRGFQQFTVTGTLLMCMPDYATVPKCGSHGHARIYIKFKTTTAPLRQQRSVTAHSLM